MVNLSLRIHPDVLFAYSSTYVEVIIRVENPGDHAVWAEADISVPDHISLAPNTELRKGRVRVGIIDGKQFLEKAVRVYSNTYTNPQMYHCAITLYIFNKDGIIDSRMEKSSDIRCEMKKEASF
ncbi:hypothetical protein KKB44_01410 [Candidatus Micrarchaeota archaeon]|nr:hypothetical protein [Candidatus Micrarchaeota archaeon]